MLHLAAFQRYQLHILEFDQMQKIVKILGMLPDEMILKANDQQRQQFFERIVKYGREEWTIKQKDDQQGELLIPSHDPIASLKEVVGADSNREKRYLSPEHASNAINYDKFVDLIYKMLAYLPSNRVRPDEALRHPFIAVDDYNTRGDMSRRGHRSEI